MKRKPILSLILIAALCFTMVCPAAAAQTQDRTEAAAKTSLWLRNAAPSPTVSPAGGEWLILSLRRGSTGLPVACRDAYLRNAEAYVKACGGVLHARKYTEYSRVVLALSALGLDAADFAGYDLIAPLTDTEKVSAQGVSGVSFALMALDGAGLSNDAVRKTYIDLLLSRERANGGWSLTGDSGDADVTAIVLQALAPYRDDASVSAAVDRALDRLSALQSSDGGYGTLGTPTCESCAQVVIALCTLGISTEDSRFVKNGRSAADAMLSYFDGTAFRHLRDGVKDGIASEQAMCALAALWRQEKGLSSLYDFSDDDPAFPDIAGHKSQAAIQALTDLGIINGMSDGTFSPDLTMDRAQFCTITVKALGLSGRQTAAFTDVPASKWYASFVGAAYEAGIVNGVGGGRFSPNSTISRQEAAVMVARAAKKLGVNTEVADPQAVLAAYPDGAQTAAWAVNDLAWCLQAGLWPCEGALRQTTPILRGEIARMIFGLLSERT